MKKSYELSLCYGPEDGLDLCVHGADAAEALYIRAQRLLEASDRIRRVADAFRIYLAVVPDAGISITASGFEIIIDGDQYFLDMLERLQLVEVVDLDDGHPPEPHVSAEEAVDLETLAASSDQRDHQ